MVQGQQQHRQFCRSTTSAFSSSTVPFLRFPSHTWWYPFDVPFTSSRGRLCSIVGRRIWGRYNDYHHAYTWNLCCRSQWFGEPTTQGTQRTVCSICTFEGHWLLVSQGFWSMYQEISQQLMWSTTLGVCTSSSGDDPYHCLRLLGFCSTHSSTQTC